MAEARSAVAEPHVGKLHDTQTHRQDFIRAWRRTLVRRFFRTRNRIRNGMWPTSIWNLVLLFLLLSVLMLCDWPAVKPVTSMLWQFGTFIYLPSGCPSIVSVLIISWLFGLVFFVILLYVRRYLLRLLLSYHGWLYEDLKNHSKITLLWGLSVRLLSGCSPTMYSCQKSLPRMPVPPLNDTLRKLIESLEPLYCDRPDILSKLKEDTETFRTTLGPKLQRILVLKSWWAQNWVTDWWEKYVYWKGRSPLPVNSNYYVLDQSYYIPTPKQLSRAASLIYQILLVRQDCDREEWPPLLLRNTIPLCMAQYEKVFSTTRIPAEDVDQLIHYDSSVSKHIVVLRHGIMYKLNVYDCQGKILPPQHLESELQWIVDDAERHKDLLSEEERSLPALTGQERTTWAKLRQKYFSHGINSVSLYTVESAIFIANLVIESFNDMSSSATYLIHGDGKSIWFDKSLNLIFYANGRCGMNCEHSFADAPVIAHIVESLFTVEALETDLYTPEGYCRHESRAQASQKKLTRPERLVWNITTSLSDTIQAAVKLNIVNFADLDLCVRDHDSYGKGFMKTCKLSPDAFIQMAIQATYFRITGKFVLIYESSMLRLYQLGRTETVRSLTQESQEFVRAFFDPEKLKKEKIRLLRQACDKHQVLYRDSMNGKGIDRHLFGLYVVSKGLGQDCEFLQTALSIPWTLSTSQQPQQQIAHTPNCDLPQYRHMICPGGGFGPVSNDGYGLSYMIPGDSKLFFHVSSKNSQKETNSTMFMNKLFETMADMKVLLEKEESCLYV